MLQPHRKALLLVNRLALVPQPPAVTNRWLATQMLHSQSIWLY
jgi:hypothetical protein